MGSLEANLAQKLAAKKEAERQQRESREKAEKHADALRTEKLTAEHKQAVQMQISDIDGKLAELQALHKELQGAHAAGGKSLQAAKKERQELTIATAQIDKLFQNEEFKQFLEDEGIHSLEDLLVAEDYLQHEDVSKVHEKRKSHKEAVGAARSQVKTRRQVKVRAAEQIRQHGKEAKLTYSDVVKALEEVIKDLGEERQMLFESTSEGQEALKQRVVSRVEERNKNRGAYYSMLEQKNLNYQNLVQLDDVKDAKEYGEELVKEALIQAWSKQIDQEVQQRKEGVRMGDGRLSEVSSDLQAIKDAENKMGEAWEAQKAANHKRVELVSRLTETFRNDANSLQRYCRYNMISSLPPEVAAKKLADHYDELQSYSNNYGSVQNLLDNYRAGQDLLDRRNTLYYGSDVGTKVPNPDYLIGVLKKQAEFYNWLLQENQTRIMLPDEEGYKKHEALVAATRKEKGSDWRKTEPLVYIHGNTAELIRRKGLAILTEEVRRANEQADALGNEAKGGLKLTLERDWAKQEVRFYQNSHPDLYQIQREKEKIDGQQKAAKDGLNLLAEEHVKLAGHTHEKVKIVPYNRNQYSLNTEQLNQELGTKQDEMRLLTKDITDLSRAISDKGREDKGWFNRKAAKIEQELAELQNQKSEKEKRAQELQTEINQKVQTIREVGVLWKAVEQADLGVRYAGKEMTVGDLVSDLTGQLEDLQKKQLDPEKQKIFDEYSALEKKSEEAEKALKPSRPY